MDPVAPGDDTTLALSEPVAEQALSPRWFVLETMAAYLDALHTGVVERPRLGPS